VPEGGAVEKVLVGHCRQYLANFKVPSVWVFVDGFPLTASGKIQKFALRDRYLEGSGS
jgi:fatty-acyl-CoA synthase